MKGKLNKREKGITLIALVITIIILLILAGVALSLVIGENGMLTKAAKAKERAEIAKIEEAKQLSMAEAGMNISGTTHTEGTGDNTRTAYILPGLAVLSADADPTMVENTIANGLVAIDSSGNEYVWIEVPKSIYTDATYNTTGNTITANDTDDIEEVLRNYSDDYDSKGATSEGDIWYTWVNNKVYTANSTGLTPEIKNTNTGCGLTYDQYYKLKNKMLSSIFTNGGFWIGRYETGNNTVTTKVENGEHSPSWSKENDKAVIKQNQVPYENLTCSQAQNLALGFSKNNEVNSSLMFGVQWNLVCKFLEQNSKLTFNDINENSTDWGNFFNSSFPVNRGFVALEYFNDWFSYKDSYHGRGDSDMESFDYSYKDANRHKDFRTSTGASDVNSAMNIYDFAGNILEYTLEKVLDDRTYYGEDVCSLRGGCSFVNGDEEPASFHASTRPGIPLYRVQSSALLNHYIQKLQVNCKFCIKLEINV